MGFFDDLETRVQQSTKDFGASISDYLKFQVNSAVVKVGEEAKGNLTAAQIAAGQVGGAPKLAAPASAPAKVMGNMLLPLAVVAMAAWFILGKKRRG